MSASAPRRSLTVAVRWYFAMLLATAALAAATDARHALLTGAGMVAIALIGTVLISGAGVTDLSGSHEPAMVSAMRAMARRCNVLRQQDPDAAGHPRPRAPSARTALAG